MGTSETFWRFSHVGEKVLEVKKHSSHFHITLNRPDVHNAFHPEMIAKLTEIFKEAGRSRTVKYVLLDANGKSFSAGADLNWMKSMTNFSEQENYQDALKLFEMFEAIYNCSVPTIARIHGNVYGGGLGLVAACDFAFAVDNTQFCFSEVKWGLSPATISPFLRTKMSEGHAKEMMLSGKTFSASRAYEIGLIHFQGSESEVDACLKEHVQYMLDNGVEAMRATKELLNSISIHPSQFKSSTAKVIAERRISDEGQEGLNYFLTKKLPSWRTKP